MIRRRFHKNLNKGCWTMKGKDCPTTHIQSVYLQSVSIHQPNQDSKAVQSVRHQGGHRSVFTWFWSRRYQVGTLPSIPESAQRISYNPRVDDWFHIEGERVDSVSQVWLTESGECWGR